jgi:hypothetical protein
MKPVVTIAFALVFAGCASAPRQVLSPFVVPAGDGATGYAAFDFTKPDYLVAQLNDYGLVPLSADASGRYVESYRFFWLRCFHKAAVFELNFFADGTGIYEAKLWEEIAGKDQWSVKKTVELSGRDLERNRRWIAEAKFFGLPYSDGNVGIDGAAWFVEVRQGDRYHAVYRHSPRNGFILEFGRQLIEDAIESDFFPIY